MLCRQLARMALRAAPSAAARSPPAAAARLHLSARRSVASLPAAQRAVQPARLAAAQHAQPVVCKLKTRKSAAKRFKVTASGKARGAPHEHRRAPRPPAFASRRQP